MNGQILDITEEEHHADPCPEPSLSASVANVLIQKSPAHAHAIHPRLGGFKQEPTRELDHGSLIHRLLLDAGPEITIIDAPDYRAKGAREEREAARGEGRIPVLAPAYAAALEAADILRQRIAALGLEVDLATGERERTIVWQAETLRGSIWCRSRLDWHAPTSGRIVDLKTTRNAHPSALERSCVTYGYAIQAAAYREAYLSVYGEWVGREEFLLLFCETEPPYAVTPAEMAGSMQQLGLDQWERAKSEWARCLKRNKWPDYGPGIARLEAPPWALSAEMMEESL